MRGLVRPFRKKVGMNSRKYDQVGGESLVQMHQKPVKKFKLMQNNLLWSQIEGNTMGLGVRIPGC